MSNLAGVHGKLAEARFFLDLLARIENGQPVTTEPRDSEATYFTSALLNACYSVLEHLKKQGKNALRIAGRRDLAVDLEKAIEDTRRQNPILDHSDGLRSLSVHLKIVDIKHSAGHGGGYGASMYGTSMYGASGSGGQLYVDDPFSGVPVLLVPMMTKQVHELEELVRRWEALVD